jgi:hypothetical protein
LNTSSIKQVSESAQEPGQPWCAYEREIPLSISSRAWCRDAVAERMPAAPCTKINRRDRTVNDEKQRATRSVRHASTALTRSVSPSRACTPRPWGIHAPPRPASPTRSVLGNRGTGLSREKPNQRLWTKRRGRGSVSSRPAATHPARVPRAFTPRPPPCRSRGSK